MLGTCLIVLATEEAQAEVAEDTVCIMVLVAGGMEGLMLLLVGELGSTMISIRAGAGAVAVTTLQALLWLRVCLMTSGQPMLQLLCLTPHWQLRQLNQQTQLSSLQGLGFLQQHSSTSIQTRRCVTTAQAA